MGINVIEQLADQMRAFGVDMHRLFYPYSPDAQVQTGLRCVFLPEADIAESICKMNEFYEENTLYFIKDNYEEHYISFRVPDALREGSLTEFLQLGPYLLYSQRDIVDEVMEANEIPAHWKNELLEYYYGVPMIRDRDLFEILVTTQAGYILGGRENVKVIRIEEYYGQHQELKNRFADNENQLSMKKIEERYYFEDMMIDAIRTGDLEKVIEVNRSLKNHRLQPRSKDNLREAKNLMVISNTLFRRAVQSADVHPAHIDQISALFAKRIEACVYIDQLDDISRDMMRKYCLLVRNHSLKGYSKIVRDAINYIDFNIQEPLSLKILADYGNVNASYLSTQFKKETGATLTDYINEKRIHRSLKYLATTDIPIAEVAEWVGIYDENYFSRLFKKYQKRTAKQYRNMMQSKV